MANRSQFLEDRIQSIKHEIAALGDLRPGALSLQYNVCGNPSCRCKADPPLKHGPDLKKSRAYRGDKPPLLQFNYLSGPETAEKQEMIELEEPNVINGLNGFSETALSAFVVAAERV